MIAPPAQNHGGNDHDFPEVGGGLDGRSCIRAAPVCRDAGLGEHQVCAFLG